MSDEQNKQHPNVSESTPAGSANVPVADPPPLRRVTLADVQQAAVLLRTRR